MNPTEWAIRQIKDLGQDLITIEVNTIEAEDITARKMPTYPHALLDIANKYARFITGQSVGIDLDAFANVFPTYRNRLVAPLSLEQRQSLRDYEEGDSPPGKPASAAAEPAAKAKLSEFETAMWKAKLVEGSGSYQVKLTNGWETFELLRWAALRVLTAGEPRAGAPVEVFKEVEDVGGWPGFKPDLNKRTRAVLWRIRRTCDRLKAVADDLKGKVDYDRFIGRTRGELVTIQDEPKPIPPKHLTLIRKAWDIGSDVIALQTVVQLDGDVILRARPQLLRSGDSPLLQVHERTTNVGLQHWHGLFNLVLSLLTDTIFRIFDPDYEPGPSTHQDGGNE